MTTNVLVRDLDLAAPHVDDARRLEVVVDGLRAAQHDGLAEMNLWGPTAEPTWWSWVSKWAVVGPARPRLSSPSWLG